jgi:hypothetical protein
MTLHLPRLGSPQRTRSRRNKQKAPTCNHAQPFHAGQALVRSSKERVQQLLMQRQRLPQLGNLQQTQQTHDTQHQPTCWAQLS